MRNKLLAIAAIGAPVAAQAQSAITTGVTPYRYTVVNGETILVEPRTRRIVQVIE